MRVLAIDPGMTTGLAYGVLDNGSLLITPTQEKFSHLDLFNQLQTFNPDCVVCEDFEYRVKQVRPSLILISLELIGVVKLWAEGVEASLWMQKASTGKGYFSDEKLRQQKVYSVGKQHARDATRHLMHWWTFGAGSKWGSEIDFKTELA